MINLPVNKRFNAVDSQERFFSASKRIEKGYTMKRSFAIAWTFAVTTLSPLSTQVFQNEGPIAARIEKPVNNVEYRHSPADRWTKASSGSILTAGCEVRTNDSSFVMVSLVDGSKLAVRPQTLLRILGDVSGGRILHRGVSIEHGRAVLNLAGEGEERFRITSPMSSALIHAGEAELGVAVSENKTVLSMGTGTAEISGTQHDCKVIVQAGHTATIDSSGCRVD